MRIDEREIKALEWGYRKRLNACDFTIFKYVVRYKYRNGLVDLEKAESYLVAYRDICKEIALQNKWAADNELVKFCNENKLSIYQYKLLYSLFTREFVEVSKYLNIIIEMESKGK